MKLILAALAATAATTVLPLAATRPAGAAAPTQATEQFTAQTPAQPAEQTSEQATAPDPNTVAQVNVLTADAVMKAGQAAMAEAVKQKQRVTVVIVDRSGVTRLVIHGDGAGPQTEESARAKAFTAAAFGAPTSEAAKNAQGANPSTRDIPGTLFLAGGVPVAVGGAPIAGIGVGGAPDGSIDESIANAGLNAIRDGLS
ncbi:heme-binding protein [Nonomuraea sp. NBC_01738]|uniref:GlcG/HbpS family heme-binding protein n=1 Tax=Nonomuraea sp. NBC_01738 TaxID=2976003 RepID=UPI002E1415A0|nr:heme-binding protein [Nonomuraea sp. NBC_01738]